MFTRETGAARRQLQRCSFRLGLAVAATLLASSATAADQVIPPDRYFSFGSYYVLPGARPVDYGLGFDFSYAARLADSNWLEGRIYESILETGSASKPDFYATGIGADYLRAFGNEGDTHVFGLAGGGVAENSASPYADGGSWFAEAGVGIRGRVWEEWGVRPRVDVRYIHDSIGDGTNDVMLALRLEVPPKRQKIVEKIVEVEKRVEVPVEVEKIVEKEAVCVVPPVAQPPADGDGDGVPDAADKCPNTLAGAKVDANGCVQEEQKISLPNIEFEPASTVLAAGGKDKLEAVVSFLQSQPEVRIDVFGHTDSQGSEKYNLKLSDGRAHSVMDYLVSRGIDAGRLSAKGFGETQPIAPNDTPEGRAKNRRVELLLRTQP